MTSNAAKLSADHEFMRRLDNSQEATEPAPITRAAFTVAEVSELLGLSLGSTYALVRAGEIPARKMRGRWIVPKRRFYSWLNDQTDSESQR